MKLFSPLFISKLANLVLRVGGVGIKFIVFSVLSKYLSNKDFGDYSLITSLITITIFVLGFDLYNFSIRDILQSNNEKDEIQSKVFTSFIFYIVIYALFFLLGFIVLPHFDYINNNLFLILFLCISEHLNQEIYRLLIGFKKVMLANILLFLRTAPWGVLIIIMSYFKINFTVSYVLKVWLISDIFTMVLPLIIYFYRIEFKRIVFLLSWLKKGIKISMIFFIGTIFLKLIEYANRFIVDYFLDREMAGVYSFYSSIAVVITLYINTVVISFELPSIIKSKGTSKECLVFNKFKNSLLLQTIIISILAVLITFPLLSWQNKPLFKEYLPMLYLLVFGAALMNISLLYHFKLYVHKHDLELLKIIVFTGVIGLIVSIILTSFLGIYGASIGFAFSGIVLFLARYYGVKKLKI
ncbi:lipopolysaccharide biosynthesis protein [Tenacibaculum xiamenense]|uniref:lipopolysaccharide biosynthesis protein n=1 Tax=Tenacibaculum xiamenense TaxID=1261553 RepID=UPI003893568C